LPLTPSAISTALPTIPATATTMLRFWLAEEAPSVAVTFRVYVPAGVLALLVSVIVAEALPLCCATLEDVPLGTPLTARVTAPEFPVTFAVIFAGVPSCGATAIEEESERPRGPGGPPDPDPLLHAAAPNHIGSKQKNARLRRAIRKQFIF